jgi:radical SAM superfamily enzyme YgiQ (UPF0313 family)
MNATILSRLVGERAEIYSFSCYIWNIATMLDLAADLKALLPNSKIIFGGPEVSFACERFDFDYVDYIVRGEGEEAIVKICNAIKSNEPIERIVDGGIPLVMKDEGILYREGDFNNGTMLYYESSRGCPYRCAYCLSSVSGGVRAKSVEQTLIDLKEFEKLDSNIKIIKFVDRTFNFNIKRANEIWRALLSDEFTKNYHFEVCANLLDEESFEIFSQMPKGKIQLEIGLQSTNSDTLDTISRHLDAQKIIAASKRVKALGNIHVHLDLIAGLPFEDMQSFRKSFDEAYFACDMLQLGFLKLLYGTQLRAKAEEYGYVASKKAPYTVLKSNWMSFEDLSLLQEIADIIDRYREGGGFENSLEYALLGVESPFDFYLGLRNFILERDGRSVRKISQNDIYALLYQYISLNYPQKEDEFSRLMHEDYAKKQVRKPPKFKK